jgi:hypothetical protein
MQVLVTVSEAEFTARGKSAQLLVNWAAYCKTPGKRHSSAAPLLDNSIVRMSAANTGEVTRMLDRPTSSAKALSGLPAILCLSILPVTCICVPMLYLPPNTF